ncbi:hypothetical protein L6164_028670 [Bauhinia variegata]|uniref:Uncharacterized protein n=1 Tax=Bauhinia variegata TaxID=167791 RepID=A0ACB9L6Q1_BAUVA|nr:hypothetical protein L6164_028670 [Bauhinia variegata]
MRHSQRQSQKHSPTVDEMQRNFRSRKRKGESGNGKMKLLVNEKVEVRSVENGLLGSWHPATVTQCGNLQRHVRYDNILTDDGLDYLIEVIGVPPVLDDVPSSTCNGRGFIRPLPPLVEFEKQGLRYGLCVDVNYQEAWREGVIFDRDDDMEKRRIFFPDVGDEKKICIDQLRITQDWDEVTENWERRGNWVFLDVLEEYEQAQYVPVSPKQIWYDVRAKKDFDKIWDWTFKVKNLWKDLVLEEIDNYLALTVKEVIPALGISNRFLENAQGPDSVEPTADVHHDASPNNLSGSNIRNTTSPKEKDDTRNAAIPKEKDEFIPFMDIVPREPIRRRYDLYPIDGLPTLHLEIRLNISRPDNEVLQQDEHVPPVEEMLSQNPEKPPCNNSGEASDSRCLQKGRKSKRGTSSVCWELLKLPRAEFCHNAVNEYLAAREKKTRELLKTKVRNHLAFLGWKIEFRNMKTVYKQLHYKYTSPDDGKFYMSIYKVCKHLKKEASMNSLPSQDSNVSHLHLKQPENSRKPDVLPSVVPPPSVNDDVNPGLLTRNGKRKRKRLRVEEKELPSRMFRSTKRVQMVDTPSLTHRKPLNVLSWLIDRNKVLPRARVYYHARRSPHSKGEGRITRDGIKCNCCMDVYGLGGFEGHASGTISCRPAASIFLEDEKSLFDVQMQIMYDHLKRERTIKTSSDWHQDENDEVCSVCHYGGDLILCDQCPSSFHKDCLGLKEITDGDWFCPSCQCGSCGETKNKEAGDGNFLTCVQCEHKYHLHCLRNRGVDQSRRYAKKWFCGKKCEKIYAGLQKLVGKPVFVQEKNTIKWTLMRWDNPSSHQLGSNNNYFVAESYCKIHLALSLMHECFETLKEPKTKRDVIEDILFSRWNELKRLNFLGFYSVLLERDDELISVATLRVHGEKVAEMPLIGTRVQYRRRGMCRILMDELEKMLIQLGVERLVLPSAHVTLDTWTKNFGFSKMTSADRKQFLNYTFLDFQGAIMCQKLLIPSQDSVTSTDEAKEIRVHGTVDPQLFDNVAVNKDRLSKDVIDPVTWVNTRK